MGAPAPARALRSLAIPPLNTHTRTRSVPHPLFITHTHIHTFPPFTPRRLCLGWLLALAEMRALLAALARAPRAPRLLHPAEPWLSFPLARPERGMPLRFEPLLGQEGGDGEG